jgi:hypothetical protein
MLAEGEGEEGYWSRSATVRVHTVSLWRSVHKRESTVHNQTNQLPHNEDIGIYLLNFSWKLKI